MSATITVTYLDGEVWSCTHKDFTRQDLMAEVHDAYTVSNYLQINDGTKTVCLPTRAIKYLQVTEEPDES